jgi:hypothetical protein
MTSRSNSVCTSRPVTLAPTRPWHPWHLPGRITAALSRDLGINDDLHAQLDRHSLVVARCWGQNGCYAYLKDAVRHVIHALVDGRIEVAMENAAYALEQEA